MVTSGNIWIDFIAPGTNKGAALEKLINRLDIKPEECMAFGDQYNDVEMLQFVGTSYAMSNAAPGISYYSTYVTCKPITNFFRNVKIVILVFNPTLSNDGPTRIRDDGIHAI